MVTSGVHRGMSLAAAAHGSHFSRNSPIHVRRFRPPELFPTRVTAL